MISIPMLLTRRGCLGWATPYFLSLFVRLASLHAPRLRDSHPPPPPPPDLRRVFLSRYFIQLFLPVPPIASCILRRSFLQKYLSSASMQNSSHQLFDGDQYRFYINERRV